MSPSNLSRLELGTQGPPSDETLESIAAALDVEAAELLIAAGRPAGGKTFEDVVLEKLDALDRDMQAVKNAVDRRR
jgi:transcriptional regulator with XRE-family HTH domain